MSEFRFYVEEGEDDWPWGWVRYRGALTSAAKGKRGRRFLKELIAALDDLPRKILVSTTFKNSVGFCAIGAMLRYRGLDVDLIQDEGARSAKDTIIRLSKEFDVAPILIATVIRQNDMIDISNPLKWRWKRIRDWAKWWLKEGEKDDR